MLIKSITTNPEEVEEKEKPEKVDGVNFAYIQSLVSYYRLRREPQLEREAKDFLDALSERVEIEEET